MSKLMLLVCDRMADEPLADLDGRTPLEVAKTPQMDALAVKGRVGCASFIPHSLPAAPDVAMFSVLGFDPKEYYTGLAPLEALALGLPISDNDWVFRSDLVTVSEGKMVDDTAGGITSDEAAMLFKELKSKLESPKFRFHAIAGHRHLLVVREDGKTPALEEGESMSPRAILGQKTAAWEPKGVLAELIAKSQAILENHEVNRVRIDLKENPANRLWLWGQGRRPKLPDMKSRTGSSASLVTKKRFMRGLGEALGFQKAADLSGAQRQDVCVMYHGYEGRTLDLKTKIKHIEAFDAKVVGPAVEAAGKMKESPVIVVLSDVVHSTAKKMDTHGHVPYLVQGPGVEATGSGSFTEKNCAQSGVLTEPGHAFLGAWLKK